MRNFKIKIDGTGTITASGRINYLCTMIVETSLREFDELALAGDLTNCHLKHIMEGLLKHLTP